MFGHWTRTLYASWALVASVAALSCENDGFVNGSTCSCPPGFGGPTCSDLSCGGTLFDGTQRKTVSNSSSSPFANLTGCACEDGWTGTGCNVCQTSAACQSGFSSSSFGQAQAGSGSTTGSGVSGGDIGQNETMVCNTQSQVFAAGQMSCSVQNPTIQHTYPLASTLNILRTLSPSLTPIPNVTSFGSSSTIYAQLFYAGVEQFFCSASSCTQTLPSSSSPSSSSNGTDWTCSNVACTCRPGTTYCGAGNLDLTGTINGLSGGLTISCGAVADNGTASCAFKQQLINSIFGAGGLALSGCSFGECVRQSVIDNFSNNGTSGADGGGSGQHLSHGVIAGLAVVGGLVGLALLLLALGCVNQRKARKAQIPLGDGAGVGVEWSAVGYAIPAASSKPFGRKAAGDKMVLDGVSGRVEAGQMVAILGPSGAGKTTLVEILAGRHKSGIVTGRVSFPLPASHDGRAKIRVGFVPQQDVLPASLTAREALLFSARLRLPESVPDAEKRARVEDVLERLGIANVADVRIGDGERRGMSGGEMRRLSIGLELVASPDVLILDEPTSGLDSVSAIKVARLLKAVAHDPERPIAVIASIHQPSSQLYQTFDQILLLAHGHALYTGPGSSAPVAYFESRGMPFPEGYNVADYLLEVASDAPVSLFQSSSSPARVENQDKTSRGSDAEDQDPEKQNIGADGEAHRLAMLENGPATRNAQTRSGYAATFLTQFEVLSGREWKILKRDKSLFIAHVGFACILGVFCGGLYFQTGITIAGFQSRVGCLFFLGALVAFSALSALHNVVSTRTLFLRERANAYYSPAAWLVSRLVFDVVPLRIIPTIIVSTITYWMAGLANDAAHFFKFLFILVLYTMAITPWNFLLACFFRNGGIAILLSALSALYQMTFAGFFVHLDTIPPVLRWLQWLAPLKYTLEALSVNEVGSGLMIQDTLDGVPVNVSASLIMKLLFGFGANNYYRDVLVLFGFIAGFGLAVIGVVWHKVRERR